MLEAVRTSTGPLIQVNLASCGFVIAGGMRAVDSICPWSNFLMLVSRNSERAARGATNRCQPRGRNAGGHPSLADTLLDRCGPSRLTRSDRDGSCAARGDTSPAAPSVGLD